MGTLFFILIFFLLLLVLPVVLGLVKVYRDVRSLFGAPFKSRFSSQSTANDESRSERERSGSGYLKLGQSAQGRKRLDLLKAQAVDVQFDEIVTKN